MGFNPRTRESATGFLALLTIHHDVSIHALVRVRPAGESEPCHIFGFNPRTRESATVDEHLHLALFDVSIHALVRVRHSKQAEFEKYNGFQSTHS